MRAFCGGPVEPPPPRYSSTMQPPSLQSLVDKRNKPIHNESNIFANTRRAGERTRDQAASLPIWRESIGVVLILLLTICVLCSSIVIFYYANRDTALYEEIVDYLDKTVSISKINYNPVLGLYEIRSDELESLGELRRHKARIWTFLFADLTCYTLFAIGLFTYFTADLSRTLIRFLFWFFLLIGTAYSLAEVSVFTVLLLPQSETLPNATEALLDHAVPHNPGGLMQMESRFGCIFNQNLYSFKRRHGQGNTCDPYVLESFLTRIQLWFFVVSRVTATLIFVLLASARNTLSTHIASTIAAMRPHSAADTNTTDGAGRLYVKKSKKSRDKAAINFTPSGTLSKAVHSTTFGVTSDQMRVQSSVGGPLKVPPRTPPPGQIDHSISYNNAAFFAISGDTDFGGAISVTDACGKFGNGSTTSSMILGPPRANSTHTTNSLVSEV